MRAPSVRAHGDAEQRRLQHDSHEFDVHPEAKSSSYAPPTNCACALPRGGRMKVMSHPLPLNLLPSALQLAKFPMDRLRPIWTTMNRLRLNTESSLRFDRRRRVKDALPPCDFDRLIQVHKLRQKAKRIGGHLMFPQPSRPSSRQTHLCDEKPCSDYTFDGGMRAVLQ